MSIWIALVAGFVGGSLAGGLTSWIIGGPIQDYVVGVAEAEYWRACYERAMDELSALRKVLRERGVDIDDEGTLGRGARRH